jgi:GNAT superfamily N-acetyltransferase
LGLQKIIGVGRYEVEREDRGIVEVAYTVHEDYQGRGLGTLLQQHLESYAKHKGFVGAAGYLFQDNVPMLKTFARKGAYSDDILEDGILRVVRYFDAPS